MSTTEQPLDNEAICTHTHIPFKPMKPQADLVHIEDIAHALSNTCRYSGHTPKFYSVAEHSVRMAQQMRKKHPGKGNKTLQLAGLLHDSSEAYLTDIPKPIKHLLEGYKAAEDTLLDTIGDAFGFENFSNLPDYVKHMDMYMLCWELRDFFGGYQKWYSTNTKEVYDDLEAYLPAEHINPWGPVKAERKFLQTFWELNE